MGVPAAEEGELVVEFVVVPGVVCRSQGECIGEFGDVDGRWVGCWGEGDDLFEDWVEVAHGGVVVDYVDGGCEGGFGGDAAVGREHNDGGVGVGELSGEDRHCGDDVRYVFERKVFFGRISSRRSRRKLVLWFDGYGV